MTDTAEQQPNPLAEGLLVRRVPDPCALVIFGASGDLTHKKLMPALYSLAFRHLLPLHFAIVGVARTDGSDDEYRTDTREPVAHDIVIRVAIRIAFWSFHVLLH